MPTFINSNDLPLPNWEYLKLKYGNWQPIRDYEAERVECVAQGMDPDTEEGIAYISLVYGEWGE